MADDRSNRGGRDRNRVAAGQGYELGYFARKHGLSRDEARSLIERIGNDRAKLNAAAERMKVFVAECPHSGGERGIESQLEKCAVVDRAGRLVHLFFHFPISGRKRTARQILTAHVSGRVSQAELGATESTENSTDLHSENTSP